MSQETYGIEDRKVQFDEECFCNKWPDVENTSRRQGIWLIKDNFSAHLDGLMDCCPRRCFTD